MLPKLRQEWLMLDLGRVGQVLYRDLTDCLADVRLTLLAFRVPGSRGLSI
jgi:hypothetical protein